MDGTALLFRAYHGYPKTFNSLGEPIGGVAGFFRLLINLLRLSGIHHFGVVFDTGKPTFRHTLASTYKAHRPPVPEDLKPQFGHVERLCAHLEIPVLQVDGYEADDVMASYAHEAKKKGYHTVLVAADKDLHQLVTPEIRIYDPWKKQFFERKDVFDKWGVYPEQMVDFQALMGDTSDGIPGVPGIGPKTAARLLQTHGSVDQIYTSLSAVEPKWHQRLLDYQPYLEITRRLLTLVSDIPIPYPIQALSKPSLTWKTIGALASLI